MAKWARDGAAQPDASTMKVATPTMRAHGVVHGLQELLEVASSPVSARGPLLQELVAMDATDVRELARPD